MDARWVKEQVDGTMSQVTFFSHAVDHGVLFTLSVGSSKLFASWLAIIDISRGGAALPRPLTAALPLPVAQTHWGGAPGSLDNRWQPACRLLWNDILASSDSISYRLIYGAHLAFAIAKFCPGIPSSPSKLSSKDTLKSETSFLWSLLSLPF